MACLWTFSARATNVQLNLITSNPLLSTGAWTVTARLMDNQSLGIGAFSIHVVATGGVTILKAATASQTLQVSNPPYSQLRSTGTLSTPNLTGISASQDVIGAAQQFDPSILRFGDGLSTVRLRPRVFLPWQPVAGRPSQEEALSKQL